MGRYNSERVAHEYEAKKNLANENVTGRFCTEIDEEVEELISTFCDIEVLSFHLKEDELGVKIVADLDFQTILRYTEKFSDIVKIKRKIHSKFVSLRIQNIQVDELKSMKRKGMLNFNAKINILRDGHISKNCIFFDVNYTCTLYIV